MRSEQTIRRTFSHLSDWDLRLRSVYTPALGSALEDDDSDWPHHPISQVAWSGLAAGNDNLKAIRDSIEQGNLYPFASLAQARAALVGASLAAWTLSPQDPATRRVRARRIAADDLVNACKAMAVLQRFNPDKSIEAEIARLESRLDDIGRPPRINLTDLIPEVTTEALREHGDEAEWEWRRGSGAAHGMIWQLLVRWADSGGASETSLQAPSGLSPVELEGSFAQFDNAYMLAYHLMRHAWTRLDHLGTV